MLTMAKRTYKEAPGLRERKESLIKAKEGLNQIVGELPRKETTDGGYFRRVLWKKAWIGPPRHRIK